IGNRRFDLGDETIRLFNLKCRGLRCWFFDSRLDDDRCVIFGRDHLGCNSFRLVESGAEKLRIHIVVRKTMKLFQFSEPFAELRFEGPYNDKLRQRKSLIVNLVRRTSRDREPFERDPECLFVLDPRTVPDKQPQRGYMRWVVPKDLVDPTLALISLSAREQIFGGHRKYPCRRIKIIRIQVETDEIEKLRIICGLDLNEL